MASLSMSDFTRRTVHSSNMLLGDGIAGSGSYTRSRKNVVTSPNLIAHHRRVASGMQVCSLSDACTRDPKKVGTTTANGRVYKMCTLEECRSRLIEAQQCGKRTLPGL